MNHKAIVLKRYVVGRYDSSVFDVVSVPTPSISEGDLLVKASFVSVDPYMFSRIREDNNYTDKVSLGQVMLAGGVGEVLETKSAKFKVGDIVVSTEFGWQEVARLPDSKCRRVGNKLPRQTYLGACSGPGITAFLGLQQLRLEKGKMLLITSAAGAVGQILGQLARREGLMVCGIAGSDEKVRYLKDVLNFEYCFNYRDKNWPESFLSNEVPPAAGFFDSVGGSLFATCLKKMDNFGKILICGTISEQQGSVPLESIFLREFLIRRLTMFGFLLTDHAQKFPQAYMALESLCVGNLLVLKEHVLVGIENAPKGLEAMMNGLSFGKVLVKVDPAL